MPPGTWPGKRPLPKLSSLDPGSRSKDVRMAIPHSRWILPGAVIAGMGAALIHLGWEYSHGGIQRHHLLNDASLPAISNAWGLLVLPLLGVLAGWEVTRRTRTHARTRVVGCGCRLRGRARRWHRTLGGVCDPWRTRCNPGDAGGVGRQCAVSCVPRGVTVRLRHRHDARVRFDPARAGGMRADADLDSESAGAVAPCAVHAASLECRGRRTARVSQRRVRAAA